MRFRRGRFISAVVVEENEETQYYYHIHLRCATTKNPIDLILPYFPINRESTVIVLAVLISIQSLLISILHLVCKPRLNNYEIKHLRYKSLNTWIIEVNSDRDARTTSTAAAEKNSLLPTSGNLKYSNLQMMIFNWNLKGQ